MKKILMFFAVFFSLITFNAYAATDITVARFFGDCEDAGNDPTTTTGEACIIASIINAFDAQNPDINVTQEVLDWGMTYEILQTRYADKNAPDLHIMHRHRIPQFAGIGVIADLSGELEAYGMDSGDIVPAMMDALTWNGGMWGIPLDIHANLMHTNMDAMSAAGLVNNGKPVYPTSSDEMLEHAKACSDAGYEYMAFQMADGFLGIRALYALIRQQGSNRFDGNKPMVDTPEVRKAINAFKQLVDAGYINTGYGYGDAQKMWMDGGACILINGTWVVDYYGDNVDFGYYVGNFPSLFGGNSATWADSHMWSVPADLKSRDPAKYDAVMKLNKFMWDNSINWSRTGHMSYRASVIASDAYKNLPHRDEYAETANIMADTPHAEKYGAIQDLVGNNLIAILTGNKEMDATLKDVQNKMKKLLR